MGPTKAMLMTAGLGTRLRPFSEQTPKPLTPVLGVPTAAFALASLADFGVQAVVANLHHLPDDTKKGLVEIWPDIRFSDETKELLGSAGGIKKAFPILDACAGSSSFFVFNADTICSVSLRELARAHARLRKKLGVTLTLAVIKQDGRGLESYREILVNHSGETIVGLGEKSSHGRMYIGCAILEPEALQGVPAVGSADFVQTILKPAIEQGKAGVCELSGFWMDVGSPRLWADAHFQMMDLFEGGRLPESWRMLLDKASKRLAPGVWVSRKCPLRSVPEQWQAPCSWFGEDGAPEVLGPRAILYGTAKEGAALSGGVGASGLWVQI